MRKLIAKNINGKKVLFLFVLTNIVYITMLIVTIPKVMRFAGGMNLLDMMPMGYDVEYVNTLLYKLGEQGRKAYLLNQIPLDLVYPFLFGISYCLLLAFILNKIGKLNTPLFYFCVVPLFAGFFDYLENLGIIAMLNNYPSNSLSLIQTSNVFSVLKSLLTTFYFITLISFLVVLSIYKVRKKNILILR